MSSDLDLALTVSKLGKSYRFFNRPQDRLNEDFWRRRPYFREFRALRGVSFALQEG